MEENKRNYLGHLTEEEKLFVSHLGDIFDKDRQEVHQKWEKYFSPELELFDLVCALFIHFLETLRRKEKLSRFGEALVILSSKMLSDAQSMKLSLKNGWTGTAMGISRMFWSANTKIMFLAYYPEYIEDWFSEKHDSYQKDKKFKSIFGEGTILKKLAEKGFTDTSASFQLSSKGLHASYWGAQIYTDEGHITFQPRPDFFKTLVLLSDTAGAISAVIGWYITHLKESFEEAFENEDERATFGQLNAKLNQACGHLMERVFSYLADTQEDREKKGGELLEKLDPVEWEKLRGEIEKRGDLPLKTAS